MSETVDNDVVPERLRPPFPYFGGKSRVVHLVWPRFGDVSQYIEPFFGSGAMLLGRPTPPKFELINDKNCFVANFWRSIKFAPEAVADFADHPAIEADLHARSSWLLEQSEFEERMMSDPEHYDPKIAGWWVWGQSTSLRPTWPTTGRSIPLKNPIGIHSRRLEYQGGIQEFIVRLASRLRNTRVACGDWSRVVTPAFLTGGGLTAVFLDPPYFAGLSDGLYKHSDASISSQVRQWAIANGENAEYRIALCGYEEEHKMPPNWEKVEWKAAGGFGAQRADRSNLNAERERIWFSPACLKPSDSLFFQCEETPEDDE